MRIMGFGFRAPKARARGMDVAGAVEVVGRNVTRFQAADEVSGICDGSFAEFACARADKLGVCSTPKMDMVHSIGADHVIDYTKEDFTQSAPRYDLILDMVGNRSLSRLRGTLTPRGTLVPVGGEGGDRWIGALSRSMQALVVSPFVSQRLRPVLGAANTQDLQFLKQLIETGNVRPVVDRIFSLSEVSDASVSQRRTSSREDRHQRSSSRISDGSDGRNRRRTRQGINQ
jgi:NADPH:quinone reductase-like Zn-dependent oxidoreductase